VKEMRLYLRINFSFIAALLFCTPLEIKKQAKRLSLPAFNEMLYDDYLR